MRPFLKKETGVGVYFKNLLFSLSEIDQDNEYYLFSSSFKDRFLTEKIPPFRKRHFRDFRYPVKVVNFLWNRFKWPPLEYFFNAELDLAHSPTPLILPTKGKKIVTVYDLFFMDYPHLTDKEARKNYVRKIDSSLRKADGVVAISQFTKGQLIKKFSLNENKVKVIYLGIDKNFWDGISQDELEETKLKFNLPSSFLLVVGASEPRKNLLNFLEALMIIHKKYKTIPLVLVGRKGQDYENLIERRRKLKLEDWVSLIGYVTEKELKCIYQSASLFAFPSFHEGFGLPLIEAMACHVPVAASSSSAIPEIAQDAALYFNPHEPEDIAEKIILALKDDNLRENLIARGKKRVLDFNWKKTADETLRFYTDIFHGSTS